MKNVPIVTSLTPEEATVLLWALHGYMHDTHGDSSIARSLLGKMNQATLKGHEMAVDREKQQPYTQQRSALFDAYIALGDAEVADTAENEDALVDAAGQVVEHTYHLGNFFQERMRVGLAKQMARLRRAVKA